jgi:hypothetical protein
MDICMVLECSGRVAGFATAYPVRPVIEPTCSYSRGGLRSNKLVTLLLLSAAGKSHPLDARWLGSPEWIPWWHLNDWKWPAAHPWDGDTAILDIWKPWSSGHTAVNPHTNKINRVIKADVRTASNDLVKHLLKTSSGLTTQLRWVWWGTSESMRGWF